MNTFNRTSNIWSILHSSAQRAHPQMYSVQSEVVSIKRCLLESRLQTKDASTLVHGSMFQSMGFFPLSTSALLARLKHFEPRNGDAVFVAPSGLGWLVRMIV
jgi:hypothetical protein